MCVDKINQGNMNKQIENLLDSGWGLDEIMQEAIYQGWSTEECYELLWKAIDKRKEEEARWKRLIQQAKELPPIEKS